MYNTEQYSTMSVTSTLHVEYVSAMLRINGMLDSRSKAGRQEGRCEDETGYVEIIGWKGRARGARRYHSGIES